MFFISLNLDLETQDETINLTSSAGFYAHAAVLAAISRVNPKISQKLHDMKCSKPFSIAFEGISHGKGKLRVNFMDKAGQAYLALLMTAFLRDPNLRLGEVVCRITEARPWNTSWKYTTSGVQTWADLIEGPPNRYIFFRFITPTAINKCDEEGNRFTWLFPTAGELFLGLARRWRAMSGPSLPTSIDRYIHSGGCVVSSHRLKTVKFKTRERTQIGFAGDVTYECRKNEPTMINALNSLARMAFFTGVGYQTARGMGAVKVGISEPL